MRFRWLVTTTLLVAISAAPLVGAQQAVPLQSTGHPSETPAYFKNGLLDLEARIWAQTQIERVFYSHRIWPKENPGPKPPFEQMVPAALIRSKVEVSLKKSAALDKFWQHPVSGEMLQTELDRMAKQTRDPATLKELFVALRNDPRLIAETLSRETLADRLIRNWYAYDTRFHAEARIKAETIAAKFSASPAVDWKSLGGEYYHQIILLDEHPNPHPMSGVNPDERRVDAEEFSILKQRASRGFTSPPSRSAGGEVAPSAAGEGADGDRMIAHILPGDRPLTLPSSPIADAKGGEGNIFLRPRETPDAFILERALSLTDTRIETESLVIPKISFDDWWKRQAFVHAKPVEARDAHNSPFDQLRANVASHLNADTFSILLPAINSRSGCDKWEGRGQPPDPRADHTSVWTGSEMIVWGGGNDDHLYLNSGGRYNPATDSWLTTSTPANIVLLERRSHTAVWTGNVMIIWGGYNGTAPPLSDGGQYNPASDAWLPISPIAMPGRLYHTAVWTGGEMIVWGGEINSCSPTCGWGYTNTGGRYNPATNSWLNTSISAAVPAGRASHSAVWSGGRMIVWGGAYWNGTTFVDLNTGGRYNPTTNSWQPTSTGANVPEASAGHVAVWTGKEAIVWGGYNNSSGFLNSGGRYNPASDSWLPTSQDANTPSRRDTHTAVWTGTEMIVWGGYDGTYVFNNGGRYAPATNSWLPVSAGADTPSARSVQTAIWTGNEMIIWGGYNGYYLNSGGRYNPSNDNWLPMLIEVNAPTYRSTHTAVWTGSEMIVWGGYSGGSYLNSGASYYPVTDSWKPSSLDANVPDSRGYHSAVWSGSEMIVWGGNRSGTGYLNSGGRYNPGTDSWLPTSLGENLPLARYAHTAVWTGSEMIVWGGFSAGIYLNSGGRYNAANDSWLRTSQGANVPSAREYHTAIWTGSEMIIWGGLDGTNSFNSGGRYAPLTDGWLPTSIGTNVPVARSSHAAVWTGEAMILWGGYGGGNLNSGGRYNPAADNWSPTSQGANEPAARVNYSAVWSGDEMIVWGGMYCITSPCTPYNSGGRYNPASDSWLPTSMSAKVPSPRSGHTAVWTGNSMMIWGGVVGPSSVGIYTSGSVSSPGNSLRGNKSSYINLSWQSINGAGSYNIKRCEPTATGCIPGTIVSTPTINQYSEPNDGVSHFYAVEAVNQCGATP